MSIFNIKHLEKSAFDQIEKLPEPIADTLISMDAAPFLQFLEKLTGIDGLIPDANYRVGSIHSCVKSKKLEVNIDFNKHQKLKLDRHFNILIYLNKDLKEEYGRHFKIWKGHQKDGTHLLKSHKTKILPIFNRMAVFSTSKKSYHGHPEP